MAKRSSRSSFSAIWKLAALLICVAGHAGAATLSLAPATSNVGVGDSFELALNVSGLDGPAALAVYDIDITFDATRLMLSVVSLGDPVLGDQLNLGSLGTVTSISFGSGFVSLYELSLDSVADLQTLQAPAFTLAVLTFEALADGLTAVTPTVVAFGDSSGLPLLDGVTGAEIQIGDTPIPEPSAALLWAAGLLVVRSGLRRRLR